MASIKLVIILTIVIQCIDGYQRIRQASDHFSDDEDFFTSGDDEDFFTSGDDDDFFASGDGNFSTCCMYGNYSCNSLNYALAQFY